MTSKILKFSDQNAVSINIKPVTNVNKNDDKATMTKELQQVSVACETKQESVDVEVQCDTFNQNKNTPEYDEPDLLMFLRRKKNLFEHAFLEQSTSTKSSTFFKGKNSNTQTNCINNLKVRFGIEREKEDFRVNKIALNIKGMVLAVAVGASKHMGSCEHNSFICGWNLFRSNINETEPHWTINISGCVLSLAWHPRKSTIFASGTVNGVISVFDIGKEEGNPLLYQTQLNEYLHYDSITCLDWCIYKVNNNLKVLLGSISLDGKLLLWDMADK